MERAKASAKFTLRCWRYAVCAYVRECNYELRARDWIEKTEGRLGPGFPIDGVKIH